MAWHNGCYNNDDAQIIINNVKIDFVDNLRIYSAIADYNPFYQGVNFVPPKNDYLVRFYIENKENIIIFFKELDIKSIRGCLHGG